MEVALAGAPVPVERALAVLSEPPAAVESMEQLERTPSLELGERPALQASVAPVERALAVLSEPPAAVESMEQLERAPWLELGGPVAALERLAPRVWAPLAAEPMAELVPAAHR